MNICVVGGGNIGTLILGELGFDRKHHLRLLTSRPFEWSNNITVIDAHNNSEKSGFVDIITDNPQKAIEDAEIIFITVPSHVTPSIIDRIYPYLMDGVSIGIIPGSGGAELYLKKMIKKDVVIFGFQRVHSIARLKEYGKSVYQLGRKKRIELATIPSKAGKDLIRVIENLFNLPCVLLDNYLNITLTPSNPILHTVRLFKIFNNYTEGIYYDEPILFYEEWDDDTSEILLNCDNEVQLLCKELNLSGIMPLGEYYESKSKSQLTNKIKSIEAFKNIKAPMIFKDSRYIPDLNSRYFIEDFIYGLCIIKSFSMKLGIETPTINTVLRWYEKISGLQFFTEDGFNGKDIKVDLTEFHINSKEDIERFYKG